MSEAVRTVFLDASTESVELRAEPDNPGASFGDMLDFYRGQKRNASGAQDSAPTASDSDLFKP